MSSARAELSLGAIESISSFLSRECGLVFSSNKLYLFEQRLPPLFSRYGLDSLDALAHELLSNAMLRRDVIHQMTTHETSFFRDTPQFSALERDVLPKVVERITRSGKTDGSKGPGIWCSACSTGQEPYTLAMLLSELSPNICRSPGAGPRVLATDISSDVIDRAKLGVFSALELNRGLSKARQERYFQSTDAGFLIDARLKGMVDFRALNLTRPFGALGKFELVLCRNALIYFSREAATRIVDRIAGTQPSGGFLMLGASESLYPVHEAYQEVNYSGLTIYKKR